MKKSILALTCMAALFAPASDIFAESGTASARIGTAISISVDRINPVTSTNGDLGFGYIIPGTGGTVTVTSAGVITPSTGLTLTTQLPTGAAQFKVTGEADFHYSITMDNATIITNGSGGSMNVTGLEHNATGTLDGSGEEIFRVGGVLSVSSGQATGSYTGTFNVDAAYN
jgi:hypothetical protein